MSPPSNQPKPHLLAWNPSPYTAIPNPQSDISLPESSHSQTPPHKLRTTLPFLLHLLFFTTYSTLFFTSQRQTNNLNPLGIPYTQKIFEVNTSLKHSSANLYAGDPSEELEAAWQKLLKNSNIRIPESEIKKLGRLDQSVRFTDGSGYFAQMSVYHHLHCIKRLHKSLHLEHYWPNATTEELFQLRAHNSHCLNTLRQAITCQGDSTLITFKWGVSQPVPLGNFSSPHVCRSWEDLDKWNAERGVDVFVPGLVVHPRLGPAYGDPGEREGTGVVVEKGEI